MNCFLCLDDAGPLHRFCSCTSLVHPRCFQEMICKLPQFECRCAVCKRQLNVANKRMSWVVSIPVFTSVSVVTNITWILLYSYIVRHICFLQPFVPVVIWCAIFVALVTMTCYFFTIAFISCDFLVKAVLSYDIRTEHACVMKVEILRRVNRFTWINGVLLYQIMLPDCSCNLKRRGIRCKIISASRERFAHVVAV